MAEANGAPVHEGAQNDTEVTAASIDVGLHGELDTAVPSGADRAMIGLRPTLRRALQSHPARPEAEMVTDYRALRAVIGGIIFVLVPTVYIGNWLLFTRHVGACFWPNLRLPDSLSGYYYTHMRNLFVGAMCAVGIFLAAYRGYDRWDNRFTNVAGVAAICIALCPTMPPSYTVSPKGPNLFFTSRNACGPATPLAYTQSASQRLFGYVHDVSLIVLFSMVFLMVLVQFTRTKGVNGQDRGDPSGGIREWWMSLFSLGICAWWRALFPANPTNPRKKRRNKVYVICASVIFLCGVLAVVTAIWPSLGNVAPWLLFAESGAFLFFGIAWYIKGAASAPIDDPQLLVWALSRTVRRWLADSPQREPVADSESVSADLA